jgi:hypothetical protein
MPDISVCIANLNQCALLRQCLTSLYEHAEGLELEVFVIDNASVDGSVDMVRTEFPAVKLILNQENRGYAAANNQAILQSRGRYVLVINNDVVLYPDALQRMVAFMDEHPRTGLVGPKVLNPDGTLQPSCSRLPGPWGLVPRVLYLDKLFPDNRWTGTLFMSYWDYDTRREVDMVMGCCMLVRRAAIEQVGLMDERFFFYAEEADWCYRIRDAGWAIYFLPEARFVHYGGQSTQDVALEMHVQHFRSRLRFFEKHHGRGGYRIARGLSVVQVGLRLLYHGLARLWPAPPRRERARKKWSLYWPTFLWLVRAPHERCEISVQKLEALNERGVPVVPSGGEV